MTDLRIVRAVTPTRGTNDDMWMAARGTRDGSIIAAPWTQALAMEGRVFVANIGTLTTAITGTAGAPDNLQPDATIRVPSGTTILPLYVSIICEASAGTVNELIIGYGDADIGNATSNAATVGPLSTRRDSPVTSNCVARMEYSANGTAFSNYAELARWNNAAEPLDTLVWKPENWTPVLVGAATLYIHAAATSTAPTFFATIVWAEVPSNSIT